MVPVDDDAGPAAEAFAFEYVLQCPCGTTLRGPLDGDGGGPGGLPAGFGARRAEVGEPGPRDGFQVALGAGGDDALRAPSRRRVSPPNATVMRPRPSPVSRTWPASV